MTRRFTVQLDGNDLGSQCHQCGEDLTFDITTGRFAHHTSKATAVVLTKEVPGVGAAGDIVMLNLCRDPDPNAGISYPAHPLSPIRFTDSSMLIDTLNKIAGDDS